MSIDIWDKTYYEIFGKSQQHVAPLNALQKGKVLNNSKKTDEGNDEVLSNENVILQFKDKDNIEELVSTNPYVLNQKNVEFNPRIAFPTSTQFQKKDLDVESLTTNYNLQFVINRHKDKFMKEWAIVYTNKESKQGYSFNNLNQVVLFQIIDEKSYIVYKNIEEEGNESTWDKNLDLIGDLMKSTNEAINNNKGKSPNP